MALEQVAREGLFSAFQGFGKHTGQPIFEDSDTPDGSLITVLPVLKEVWFLLQGKIALKGPQHAFERADLVVIGGAIAREMDIDTAPGELGAEVANHQQI